MIRSKQRGMALIVGLILLALMTVMAITTFNVGRTSMDIVGNMQARQAAVNAANSTIQEALSTVRLFQAPTAIFLTPCLNVQNQRCFDINGDGVADIKVRLSPAPTCIQSQSIMSAAIVPSNASQAGCVTGVGQTGGIEGSTTGASLCAYSVWEVKAIATDLVTEAEVEVTEGAGVQVSTDDIGTTC